MVDEVGGGGDGGEGGQIALIFNYNLNILSIIVFYFIIAMLVNVIPRNLF